MNMRIHRTRHHDFVGTVDNIDMKVAGDKAAHIGAWTHCDNIGSTDQD